MGMGILGLLLSIIISNVINLIFDFQGADLFNISQRVLFDFLFFKVHAEILYPTHFESHFLDG